MVWFLKIYLINLKTFKETLENEERCDKKIPVVRKVGEEL